MELKELYQEIILDHAKNPRNKGKCENYNHDANCLLYTSPSPRDQRGERKPA